MSAGASEAMEQRVLLLAPTAKDAAMTEQVFASIRVACTACETVEALCAEIGAGAGAVVLTEHACLLREIGSLIQLIREQPPWSDLPVVVLANGGADSPLGRRAMELFGNVTILERPVQMASLASVVRTLIRSRQRQYQIRQHIKERDRLLAGEREARQEAERVGRVKDEFLATLSHELRTPLSAILGWSQLLARGKNDPGELDEGLKTIERNARAQTQIIEDLLDMSRIINGNVRFEVQRLELEPVIEAAMETVRPAACAKGIELQSVLTSGTGLISGDPARLQQVFWNLLSNAVKFTPRGGTVQVVLERVNSHMEARVSDTGEGISAEFLPHVFDRFRQADPSTARRHGGLGLGLAIVKQLVELHGGTIQALSPGPGKGSTFVVTLPLAPIQAETAPVSQRRQPRPTTEARSPDRERPVLEGVKVLVVDDEPDARALLKRLLEECRATVITAGSAAEALEIVKNDPPAVVVSDIGMPVEDGYALIRRLRALEKNGGGDTPAVALTAYARSEDRVRAMQNGFQMHLAKPVDPTELVMVVAALAGRAGEVRV